jgi:hypothetical protein
MKDQQLGLVWTHAEAAMALVYWMPATGGGGGMAADCPGARGRGDIDAVRVVLFKLETSMGNPRGSIFLGGDCPVNHGLVCRHVHHGGRGRHHHKEVGRQALLFLNTQKEQCNNCQRMLQPTDPPSERSGYACLT